MSVFTSPNIVVFLSLFILSGCQGMEGSSNSTSNAKAIPGRKIVLTEGQKAKIKSGMAATLKDPYSAVYGPMLAGERIWQGQQEVIVCGMVNAKNSFGGYGGYSPFIGKIVGDGPFQPIVMGEGSQNAPLLVGGACRTAGLPILDMPIDPTSAI